MAVRGPIELTAVKKCAVFAVSRIEDVFTSLGPSRKIFPRKSAHPHAHTHVRKEGDDNIIIIMVVY